MNGGVPFVYLAPCGCVLSRAGLKALAGTGATTPPSDTAAAAGGKNKNTKDEEEEEKKQVKLAMEICPQCGTKYEKATDVRTLNPDVETEERMRVVMEARQRAAKAAKASKSKKRKNINGGANANAEDGADTGTPNAKTSAEDKGTNHKAPKKARTDGPSLNPTVSALSSAVMDALAGEEAKRKAGMSEAVRSLYEGKANASKETFMTRTFNRVSHLLFLAAFQIISD